MGRLILLGVEVDPLTMDELNGLIEEAVRDGRKIIIANHNLHSVYLYHSDSKMRAFFKKADVIHIDGMPLVYWARALGYRVSSGQRVTYIDWIYSLASIAETKGWRIFYLGGKLGVASRAALRLREKYPRLEIRTHHGYFAPEENGKILADIAVYRPHILMVGMGMPRQEHWVLDNLDKIQANAILTAGACFDYVAGAIPTPPRWMGRIGFEWLYRLMSEPRRLWRRYLWEPWFLLPLLIGDVVKRIRRNS
ncbi:WecB/TagA/CpsF family glycosyltransferase [Thermaerobacter composti]|uniref:WecB/TagA/CpsF family glycosyltransferase n=1 Tax=Thermaerobacter composti TaxID=554949 RepID=A0ABZ0QQG0_9FIRM|nr:WecB/TagA/CpsF family glycosyltransferase [Thermaerobacter composti]WPD19723.1 WecB/TagA/CpsF family glycosyltransferase [Thermaerobacter composti]